MQIQNGRPKDKTKKLTMNPMNRTGCLTRIEPEALLVNIQQKLEPLEFELMDFIQLHGLHHGAVHNITHLP